MLVIKQIKYMILTMLVLQVGLLNAQQPVDGYTKKQPSSNGTGKVYLGREIAQVMSFEGFSWLERDTRSQEENTNLAISRLPVGKTTVVADIGAGSGFYTFRIAPKVKQIYAVEIQDDAIKYLRDKSKELKLTNVVVVKGSDKSPGLPQNTVDLVVMVDVYHELLFPREVLQAIKKSLKPKGKLLLIEYKAEDPQVAIKEEHKMTVKQVTKELSANGFNLIQNGQFMPIQHFLVFQKD
ncbi:class I SAM-dependent methyltransferase [Pedobacter sp. JCM 36344]|uniref:class I SAM-dependent methyltransferase n=1 Tax=Pedobacter sp. JCM 36344 TaxID=3374280 RepID=UPI00397DC29A